MRLRVSLPFLASAALILCSCDRETAGNPKSGDAESRDPSADLTTTQHEEAIRRGSEAASALMMSLSAQLKAALSSGPPASAVKVCQQIALPATASVGGQFEGVTIRRTSLKPRNPQNAPDSLDRTVLEHWEDTVARKSALPEHELHLVDEGIRFYQPLLTKAVCLKCHGESASFGEDLRRVLDEHYPDDQARGYKEGDLRGAIRVTLSPRP